MDQVAMAAREERDLPPLRNSWSGRVWLGTVTVSLVACLGCSTWPENPGIGTLFCGDCPLARVRL